MCFCVVDRFLDSDNKLCASPKLPRAGVCGFLLLTTPGSAMAGHRTHRKKKNKKSLVISLYIKGTGKYRLKAKLLQSTTDAM